MTLDDYLAQHFLTLEVLAARCELSSQDLSKMIKMQWVMAPSYVVTQSSFIDSHVFGRMECMGAMNGWYFHPASQGWVQRAKEVLQQVGEDGAYETLRDRFETNYRRALAELNNTLWALPDCFAKDGTIILAGMATRLHSTWLHHLRGTYGLCVTNPESETTIARKEILQEKLSALSQQGDKETFSRDEAEQLIELIDTYACSSMPFSPIEYSRSSRRRLVDDLRPRVLKSLHAPISVC